MCNGYGSPNGAGGAQSRGGPRSSVVNTRRNSTGSPVAPLSSVMFNMLVFKRKGMGMSVRELLKNYIFLKRTFENSPVI